MKKKVFAPLMGAVVLGLSAYAGYRTYDAYAKVSESDLLLANAEALALNNESGTSCPSPYDVPDHYWGYVKRTGTQTVSAGGYIIIAGKKFPVGGNVEGTVTFTYEIAGCSQEAKGSCCPFDKIGDIKNVSVFN